MADTLVVKRGDRRPSFRGQCLDGTTPVNLTTAASAKLILKSDTVTVTPTLVIEDATLGKVRYDWTAADILTAGVLAAADTYRAEVEVTWGDGTKQTFPAGDYGTVIVISDLG